MQKSIIIILLVIYALLFVSTNYAQEEDISGAVVKVYTVYNRPSYYRPWQMEGQNSCVGSGFIVKGNRIMTNAHVVADATFIQVKKAGNSKKYTAEVYIAAHICDLAVLKLKDESFFEGEKPLSIGVLPEIRDKVVIYGFPTGGEELGITEGVISRVEMQYYAHGQANLLSCQTDAAINQGNSGGPVIKDDHVVGVAFEAGKGENISYMVPPTVIKHFLRDIKDGKLDGIPEIGFSSQKLENPDMRSYFKMGQKHSGILINEIYPDSPARENLLQGDVVLSIDGTNIADDGTCEFRNGERTDFNYLIQRKYIGDIAKFEVLRDGKEKSVDVRLTKQVNHFLLVSRFQYDREPSYFIVGGLVFQPVTRNFLYIWNYEDIPSFLKSYYLYEHQSKERKELVVLTSILTDELNVGYAEFEDNIITRVNSKNIATLKDFVKAVETNSGDFYIFEDEWGNRIVLDKKKTRERQEIILKKYKVPSDRSSDLKGL